MPKYDSEAKKIIAQINREAKRRYGAGGYSKAEKAKIKSAYQTGRVESNFTHRSAMTDHDSQGWRQERASLYKDPMNLRRSVRRYFNEADELYRAGMKSYQVAANVQRPAAQYRHRYGLHQGESEALFKQLRGAEAAPAGLGPASQAPSPSGRAGALRELLKASATNPSAENSLSGMNIAKALITAATGSETQPAETDVPAVRGYDKKLAKYTQRAEKIAGRDLKYLYGGGHVGSKEALRKYKGPLDCSAAVSKVLGIDPRVSGQFETWGKPGASKSRVTIYANDEHVLMYIPGKGFFGTSGSNPGGGANWIKRSAVSKAYLSRFTARHE